MLAEKHDIDQLFQDRLEDYDANPPMYVWKNIEDGLDNRKRAHRLALIRGLSIAAAVVLAFVAGWMFTQPHQEQVIKEVVVVPQSDSGIRQQQINSDVKTSISQVNENVVPVKMNARVASVQPVKMSNRAGFGNDNTAQINQSAVFAVAERRQDETWLKLSARLPSKNAGNNSGLSGQNENWIQFLSKYLGVNNSDASHLTISEQELRDRSIIASNIQEYAKKDKPVKRWRLAAEASPLFSGVSSSGERSDYLYAANALSKTSPTPSTSTEPTLSGGVMFGYKLSKRLSVKSGIVYSKIRHNTNQVSVFGGNNSTYASAKTDYGVNSNSTAYAANTEVGLVNFGRPPESIKDGAYLAANMSNSDLSSTTTYASNADLKQNLEYIEIPVLVAYHLIDRKVNVDLTGGMSTNILVGNNASLYEGGVKTQGGETSQLRDLVYAGTVGLGLGYDLSKRVTVTLEPRMKYYLNSISTSNHINYRPYQLGIYTGLTYAFN
ncbi:hypothetical protein PbJCM13498_11000 [Prolixibacter bellariivorans]|uniref:Outer membrane protein beta-barrel domain-containing protein n=1 Tax=Prolixibacter bellariivorans TaxID=314319 RepID=A0A5M4AXN6_9BACT|nr:outer membrane beta-barrel protein [Prolixibacter bellariivorans]GET32237.1 hypothetical protein PbJCM13498_11000 [Prolixibacter bellariivorans]